MTTANRARLLGHLRDPFEPTDIPRSLIYAMWDFEQTGRMTVGGGAISAFSDPITGASFAQGTGANQPALDATGFNGRQCSSYDGTDTLRNTTAVATLGWPTGGAFELWAAVEWTGAELGSGLQGYIFNYPVNSVNTSLLLSFVQANNSMCARFRVGTGAASVDIIDTKPLLTGRHILRAVSDGSTIRLDVDGVGGAPVACVASGFTGGPRHTIGGNSAATAGSLMTGKINFLGFFRPLPAIYSAGLYRNLNIRKG